MLSHEKAIKKNRLIAFSIALLLLFPNSIQLRPLAVPIGPFYITAVEIIIFFLIGLWLFKRLFSPPQIKTDLFKKYIFSFLILYFVYLIFGIISQGFILALGDFRNYLPIILYFPIVYFFNSESAVCEIRKAIFFVLIIVSAYTIVLFLFFNDFMSAQAVKAGKKILGERIYIINSLSTLFVYLNYIIVKLFTPDSKFRGKAVFFIILVSNAFMLLIMQSRSLWVMFAIISMLSIFSFRNFSLKIRYLFSGFFAIILLVAIGYMSISVLNYTPPAIERIQNSVVDRASSFFDLTKIGDNNTNKAASIGTLETRLETAKKVTEDYVLPHIYLGTGFGSQIPMVDSRGNIYMWKFHIDNAYLSILAKFGIPGFILYFAFTAKILISLFRLLRLRKISYEDAILVKGFMAFIFACIFASFFSSIFIRQQPLIVGFLIMLGEIEFMHVKYRSDVAS